MKTASLKAVYKKLPVGLNKMLARFHGAPDEIVETCLGAALTTGSQVYLIVSNAVVENGNTLELTDFGRELIAFASRRTSIRYREIDFRDWLVAQNS